MRVCEWELLEKEKLSDEKLSDCQNFIPGTRNCHCFSSAPEVTLVIMNWVENYLICRAKLSNHPFSCGSFTGQLFT